jgi:hypothetical protein
MAENPPDIWDQHEGEPDESYVRFLYYRNLGPTRSLADAYHFYIQAGEIETKEKAIVKASKRRKTLHVSGQWYDDSAKYQWEYRANQWDIHILSQSGRVVIDSFFKALANMATQSLELLQTGQLRPVSYSQLLEGLTLVGSFITPEALESWQHIANNNRADSEPEGGSGTGNISRIQDKRPA